MKSFARSQKLTTLHLKVLLRFSCAVCVSGSALVCLCVCVCVCVHTGFMSSVVRLPSTDSKCHLMPDIL